MKVLIATTYIFNHQWPEFTRNRTGFGLMVNDIFESISKETDIYLISQVITKGHGKVIRHTWGDVFKNAKIRDWRKSFKYFFEYKQRLKSRARYFYYALNSGSFRNVIKSIEPDIVHIQGIGTQIKPFIDVCEEERVPYIVTLHGLIGLDESICAPTWDKNFEKNFLIKADSNGIPITVVSTGIKKRIEKEYLHHEANNIRVVCNGTRINCPVDNSNNSSMNLRNKFHMRKEEKVIVAIGNINENKNQFQIIDAFATNIIKTPCKVFLCGKDFTDGEIDKRIEQKRLSNKIILLGFLSKNDISRVLEQADLNIVASKNEGFGLSIIESYTHGVPTVTFNDLDAVVDLYHKKSMLTANSRDDKSFAEKIETALETKWDKEWIIEYSKKYSLEVMAKKYKEVYKVYSASVKK